MIFIENIKLKCRKTMPTVTKGDMT